MSAKVTWRKLKDTGEWGVAINGPEADAAASGDVVEVARQDGTTSLVRLGVQVAAGYEWATWTVERVREERPSPRPPVVRRPGGAPKQALAPSPRRVEQPTPDDAVDPF